MVNTQKPYFLAYISLISAKKQNKKLHASVPLRVDFGRNSFYYFKIPVV
jgi:hypothetical protein